MSDPTTAGGMRVRLPIASATRTRRWLSGELRRRWVLAATTVVVAALGTAVSLVPIVMFGVLVDRVRAQAAASTIVAVVAVITAAALVGGILAGWATVLISRLAEAVLADLRERTVERALTLPIGTVERVGKGDLLSRVGDDVALIGKAVADVVPNLVSAVLLVVLSLVAMAGIDWRLGLAGAVAIPLYGFAFRWYMPRSGPLFAAERVAMAERSQELIASTTGVRTVRAYGLEDAHLAAIDGASARARDLTVGVFTLFTRFVGRGNRAEFVGLASILVAGFVLVGNGTVTVGAATAAALLFHRLFNPIGMLMYTFNELQSAGAGLARLVGVVTMPEPPSGATDAEPASAQVLLSGVGHSYRGSREVLRDIDIQIDDGERVALVGASGAGKSTLAGIAAGSLTPTAGTVTIGGVSLADLGDRLRHHVVVISQEVHLFAGPLAADLRLARPDATIAEVLAALDVVGAGDWVRELEAGVDTVVGEGGQPLTAAQAQQVALARLVLADPPVAVLDEATAEAGSAGARDLERAADAATRGRTTLVVAHRLTQAAAADRVIVLDAGVVVEEGSHADLVTAGGDYARLWRAWSGRADPAVAGAVDR